ncbi:MAG: SDR family oxidoreductase [Candidatus Eremiobacteraeota bacterium]|nr:SDR family oxidoreductase [Candidatus Eremiobacteraeota bacterium]
MKNRLALITGASSGIGQATAVALARRGIDSILTYHSNPSGVEATLQAVRACGAQARALRLDVGRSETFPAFVAELGGEPLHYLVNNAGVGRAAAFGEASEELFDELMRVLLKGPYFLTQALLPLLAEGGAVVHVSSSSSEMHCVSPGYSAYATMKGGLNTMSRYQAKELAERGIRVNCVSPGPTRTRLGGDAFAKHPEYIEPLARQTALGRIGESEDVGEVIAALLAELTWVTGQNLEVSGGFRL